MMMESEILFYTLLPVIAFLYASVGHGGASGYLALMALFSFSPTIMRPTALLLNMVVSAITFSQYYRHGYFRWRLCYPFLLASVPAAFCGGLLTVDPTLYKKILAVLLLFPIVRLLGVKLSSEQPLKKMNLNLAFLIGAFIGFLSGMIGIGGGILLSPVILLFHWADMKQTAAATALFILLNSLAGMAGVSIHEHAFTGKMGLMLLVALAGGMAGSYLGAKKFETTILKRILASVLIIASVKLVIS